MKPSIRLRKATQDDLPTLLQFEQAIIEYERPFEERMQTEAFHYYDLSEIIELSNAELVVAEHQGKLVGSGFIHIRRGRDYLDYDHHGYLGFMYVDPDYRGQGINKSIIQELVSWAKSRALSSVCLTVFAENQSAIQAYNKAGFHQNLIEMRLNFDK